MQFLGLSITRTKQVGTLQPVDNRGGWWPLIRESFAGAWQSNIEVSLTNVLSHPTVFACISLIASDIAKMRLRLVELDTDGIWSETFSPAYSPVLKKPNRYQTRIAFVSSWLISKLAYGNTYALKQRDNRGVVVALYVLDPNRVTPLVAPDGSVYYQLSRDDLSRQPDNSVMVPASEIIHDLWNTLYHPLVGLSPIYACGLAATLGLRIQTNSANFFTNGARPSGVLMAPGAISQANADAIKAYWQTEFTGENGGKVAVLTQGLKYEPMSFPADKSQTTEQWRETALAVCQCFLVPAYKVGAGPPPAYNNVEALNQDYYSQCLQILIESIELLLDEGIGLAEGKIDGRTLGTEFDLDDLLRMDSATMMTTISAGVGAGVLAPNEGRLRLNYRPVEGGDTPYLQQQNYSLAALDARDKNPPPSALTTPTPPALPAATEDTDDTDIDEDVEKDFDVLFHRSLMTQVEEMVYAAQS